MISFSSAKNPPTLVYINIWCIYLHFWNTSPQNVATVHNQKCCFRESFTWREQKQGKRDSCFVPPESPTPPKTDSFFPSLVFFPSQNSVLPPTSTLSMLRHFLLKQRQEEKQGEVDEGISAWSTQSSQETETKSSSMWIKDDRSPAAPV